MKINKTQKKILISFINKHKNKYVYVEKSEDDQYYLRAEEEKTGEMINEIALGKKLPKELKKLNIEVIH